MNDQDLPEACEDNYSISKTSSKILVTEEEKSEPQGPARAKIHRVCSWIMRYRRLLRSERVSSGDRSIQTTNSLLPRTRSYDGLRGVACLIVFNFHFLYPYTWTNVRAFGVDSGGDSTNRYPHQLPFLCLLIRGRAMVTLFFGISGYVLSYHFLDAIRTRQWVKSSRRLASLLLRRWVRLFIPATISMTLVMMGAFFGAFDKGRELENNDARIGQWEPHPRRFPNFRDQLKDFTSMWWTWSSPWTWSLYYSDYDPHTWTIPVEFRASVALFALLLACTSLKTPIRLGLTLSIVIYCFASNRWDVAVFVGGALCADLHQLRREMYRTEKSLLPQIMARPLNKSPRAKRIAALIGSLSVLLAGMYILSFPDEMSDKAPGFRFLDSITPPKYDYNFHFWQAFGSIFVLWALESNKLMRRLLECRVPQYLGKVSYALYLVHGPLLHSAGFALQPAIWAAVGRDTTAKWLGGLFLGWMTMLTLSLLVAHLFWRFVDTKLVSATRKLEKLVSQHQ